MPCRSEITPSKSEIMINEIQSVLKFLDEVNNTTENKRELNLHKMTKVELETNLNKKTAELCRILKTRSANEVVGYSADLQIWWIKHKEYDRKRKEEEKAKKIKKEKIQNVLSKLTEEEIKLLGINAKQLIKTR